MVENRSQREESPNKWNAAALGFAKDFAVSAAISGIIRTANSVFYKKLTTVHSINDWWIQGRWKLDGVIALMFGAFGAFEDYHRAENAEQQFKDNRRENAELRHKLGQVAELTKERPVARVEAASAYDEALLAEPSANHAR
ncbi:MAG: hypothetical protein ACOYJ2_08830 [Rickettsiales bacterium]